MAFVYTVLICGFPLILLSFEWGLRTIIGVDSWGFTGPTLAAAALSLLVPLAKPKVIVGDPPAPRGTILVSSSDQAFVGIVWTLVLAFLFVWAVACFYSLRHPNDVVYGVSTHLAIGLGSYSVSLIMTVVKEFM